VRLMLGSVDHSYVFRLIDALAQGDGKTVVETSEALRLNGLSAASTLEEMSAVLQRMAVLQAVPSSAAADDTDPDAADLARLAALMPADETQLLYSICLHGRAELGLAPDEYAALTMALLRLLAFKPNGGHQPPAEKKTLIDTPARVPPPATPPRLAPARAAATVQYASAATKIEARSVTVAPPGQQLHVVSGAAQTLPQARVDGENRPLAPVEYAQEATNIVAIPVRIQADSRAETAAGHAAAALVPTEEGAFWQPAVQALIANDAILAMVRELALQSQLVARDTDQWLLRVERESLNQPGSRDRLATALQGAGYEVRLPG